jgi:hypothetical protein
MTKELLELNLSTKDRSMEQLNATGKKMKNVQNGRKKSTQNVDPKSSSGSEDLIKHVKSNKDLSGDVLSIGSNDRISENSNSNKTDGEFELNFHNYGDYIDNNFPMLEKTFSENLDINELHEFLMKKFEFEREHKTKLLLSRIGYENMKLEQPLYRIEIAYIKNETEQLENEYNELIHNTKQNKYLSLTKNILERYNQIGPKKKVISFNNNKQSKKEDLLHIKYRKLLIEKYIDLFQRFHNIHIIYNYSLKTTCQVCNLDLSKYILEDGLVICPRCSTEKTMMIHTSIVSEVKYVNSKDGYEDRENFWKALQRFQGKQNNHIPDRLYKELDEYFRSFGLPIGDEICRMELTKKGTRGNTSRGMMFKALSETNNSVFYEDVNLICHLYWGWLLPDISANEEQIMNDYDMTQEVFKKIPKDRRSSLNAQYRLWQHLRIRGYKYPFEDFKIVKTPDILVEHDRIMKIMCDECGLPFIPAL